MADPICQHCGQPFDFEWTAKVIDGKRKIVVFCSGCGAIFGVVDGE